MGLTPFSNEQQGAVEALVTARRVEKVPADNRRAATFLGRARDAIADAQRLQHPHVAYNVAYDALHDVGEALLAAYGYRTNGAKGQHEALGRFIRAIFDEPPARSAARTFDQLRRARNANRYAARPVGKAEVQTALNAASTLAAAAQERGVGQ